MNTRKLESWAFTRTAMAIALTAAGACHVQEQPIPVTSASESHTTELTGPQNLPGHPPPPELPQNPATFFRGDGYFLIGQTGASWTGGRACLGALISGVRLGLTFKNSLIESQIEPLA